MKSLGIYLSVSTFVMLQSVSYAQPQLTAKTVAIPTTQQQLIHAVVQDQIDVVHSILAKGGDPNARSEFAAEDKWMLDNQPGIDPNPPSIVLACRFMSIKGPRSVAENPISTAR